MQSFPFSSYLYDVKPFHYLLLSLLFLGMGLEDVHAAVYAVVISGGRSKMYNHERYWNDCAFLYRTLRQDYAIPTQHINLLMADGDNPATDMLRTGAAGFASSPTDLDGDGLPDLHLAATLNNLTSTFDNLAKNLTPSDHLLLFIVNHAERPADGGQPFLWLWNGEQLSSEQLAAMLSPCRPAAMTIVLGQCYAGAFAEVLQGEGRVVMAACSANQLSWATPDRTYDEFIYHWTCAVAGHDEQNQPVPSDLDADSHITMAEAFTYARQHDRRPETPLLLAWPEALPAQYSLAGAVLSITNTLYTPSDPSTAIYDLQGRHVRQK